MDTNFIMIKKIIKRIKIQDHLTAYGDLAYWLKQNPLFSFLEFQTYCKSKNDKTD